MIDTDLLRSLHGLAGPRSGVFSVAEAERIGIGPRTLVYLERRGWIRRLRRGVYALGGTPGDRWEPVMAASVAVGPDAVLSHGTAAAVHGFDGTMLGTPELTLPSRSARHLDGVIIHRTGPVSPHDRVVRRGVAVTSPARTLIDLAGSLSVERLGRLLDDGVVRRLWTPADVALCLEGQPRRRIGVAELRRLLSARMQEDVGDSHLEQRILRFLDPLRPFEVHCQVVLFDRLYVVDVRWRWCRVAAEIDGRTYRTRSRTAFERETRKMNDLASGDWLVAHLSAGMSGPECRRAVTNLMVKRGIPASAMSCVDLRELPR